MKKSVFQNVKRTSFLILFIAINAVQLKAQSFSQFGGMTGAGAWEIGIDASNNIYTTNQNDNTITQMTSLGVTTQPWANVGANPWGIVADALGNIYTANSGTNTVSKISLNGKITTLAVGTNPYKLALDKLGNIYVSNYNSNNISQISASGIVTTPFGVVGTGPFGIATDADNNIYVGNIISKSITKITADGKSTTLVSSLPYYPYGMYLDSSSGNIFVSYYSNADYISEYGPTGAFITTFPLVVGSKSLNILGDGAGNLFASEYGTNQVAKIKIATKVVTQLTAFPAFSSPSAMVFDNSGYLYVVNNGNNTVSRSNSSMMLSVTLTSFNGMANGCTANLAWATATENNSNYFAVEASADGTNFSQMAKVTCKNSAMGANYTYVAYLGSSATTYFRLKAVDDDGRFTYSEILLVKGSGNCATGTTVKVSPNPASNVVNIQGCAIGDIITLYDMNGKKMTAKIATSSSQPIEISIYAKGNYILRVSKVDGSIVNLKLMKQ